VKHILNIGLSNFNGSVHEIKIRKLFNGLTFFGVFTAIAQVILFFEQDKLATLFHSIYGVYCIIALYLHSVGYFKFAKVSTVVIIIIFGTLASARIGSEYYPHIASFGIIGGIFIFFDIKKEWRYLLIFMLLHGSAMVLIESDILKNPEIQFENPKLLKTTIVIGTALFLALEILTVLRLSWLTEQEMISNLKKSNTELKQINEEKTVMLQEIHHRVKNNLQVVISLIKLQTKSVVDEHTIAIFEELKMRLISIARMHEMMYLSEKINKIDFKSYVQELSEMVLESTDTKSDVKLNVNTNVDTLSAEVVVPLALILNELITNSIKHAFDGRKGNKITVSFKKNDDHRFTLEYSDNGRWKEKRVKTNGFGLELIDLLAEQLDGNFERVSSDQGTKYTFKLVI
jgi:two-component sensor histidine kinase